MKLYTLDIEPTTICDLKCPFCFGPKVVSRKTEISLSTWKQILKIFKLYGVKNIVVSGGEPLLYRHIHELLKFMKELNFNIVLSTHGRHKDKLFRVAQYCDWISLPIDAIDPVTSYYMRTDHYPITDIIRTARELKSANSKVNIKIGTVATSVNAIKIPEIGTYLESRTDSFDTWKIYQYTPRRKFADKAEMLELSDLSYETLFSGLSERFSPAFRVISSSNSSRKNAYCFIYHDGEINLVNVDDSFSDIRVGSAMDVNNIDFEMIGSSLNNNHQSNFDRTY